MEHSRPSFSLGQSTSDMGLNHMLFIMDVFCVALFGDWHFLVGCSGGGKDLEHLKGDKP